VPDLNFRTATVADVPVMGALIQSAYRGDTSRKGWTTEADLLDGIRITDEQLRELVDSDGSRMLLALDGTEIIGCCQVQRRESGDAYFGTFAVRPESQTGGYGRALLEHAEEYARREWHASVLEMTVIAHRDDLIAWYERRGYARTGERRDFPYGDERFGVPLRDDLHFVVLRKPL
jgi:ribosomal protein S18 acetylase RimI-like enzyme